jgi:F0F1-type ATP synthase assembly protein I
MKDTVRRLMIIHGAVLVVTAVGGALVWGAAGSWSAAAGGLAFSIPVVVFSLMVLKASAGDPGKFWGRFMTAELLKWASAAVLLALEFLTGLFAPISLLAGFLLSVLVQVFFPIFVRRES